MHPVINFLKPTPKLAMPSSLAPPYLKSTTRFGSPQPCLHDPFLRLAMSEAIITADVGNFGKVTGFTTGNAAEFRGIPFATLPARFRRGKLITSPPNGIHDGTKYGPYPPQNPEGRSDEQWLLETMSRRFGLLKTNGR